MQRMPRRQGWIRCEAFLDVKWADVLASELVSMALVSLDEQHVFYAERDPLLKKPTPWVRTVVYPLLERGASAMRDARCGTYSSST
jgi:hypothetical protein